MQIISTAVMLVIAALILMFVERSIFSYGIIGTLIFIIIVLYVAKWLR